MQIFKISSRALYREPCKVGNIKIIRNTSPFLFRHCHAFLFVLFFVCFCFSVILRLIENPYLQTKLYRISYVHALYQLCLFLPQARVSQSQAKISTLSCYSVRSKSVYIIRTWHQYGILTRVFDVSDQSSFDDGRLPYHAESTVLRFPGSWSSQNLELSFFLY